MIFSLLKINKKISATLAGVAIGAASLWGLSLWQDISGGELLRLAAAALILLGGVALAALCAVALGKLLFAALRRLAGRRSRH
ncbi:MAG: hypothetical protein OXF82_00730 [Gammaproteobacteria bacterium]|nr:hypothetical protein [Gammaproteobacteria bacterium]